MDRWINSCEESIAYDYKSNIELTASVIYKQVVRLACGQANFPLNILSIFPINLPTKLCCDEEIIK